MTRAEIRRAKRKELIAYLESWCIACYDYESTKLLREAAFECHRAEGDGYGPAH
jgi:hypothetical protein